MGQAASRPASSAAASTTCSKLSKRRSSSLVGDVLGEAVLGAERLRCRLEDELGVAQRSERHPPDPVREGVGGLCRGLQGEPGLPRPAGPGQGEQAGVLAGEEREHLGELALPAEEGGGRDGQVRPVERLERRELAVSELVDPLRRREVLEPVLAQVRELDLDELSRRGGDEHLAAVPGGGDAAPPGGRPPPT